MTDVTADGQDYVCECIIGAWRMSDDASYSDWNISPLYRESMYQYYHAGNNQYIICGCYWIELNYDERVAQILIWALSQIPLSWWKEDKWRVYLTLSGIRTNSLKQLRQYCIRVAQGEQRHFFHSICVHRVTNGGVERHQSQSVIKAAYEAIALSWTDACF